MTNAKDACLKDCIEPFHVEREKAVHAGQYQHVFAGEFVWYVGGPVPAGRVSTHNNEADALHACKSANAVWQSAMSDKAKAVEEAVKGEREKLVGVTRLSFQGTLYVGDINAAFDVQDIPVRDIVFQNCGTCSHGGDEPCRLPEGACMGGADWSPIAK